jgi:hypothetical protein
VRSTLQSFQEQFFCRSFGEAIDYHNWLIKRHLAQIADWNAIQKTATTRNRLIKA